MVERSANCTRACCATFYIRMKSAWRKSIEVFDEDAGHSRTLALFPEDRCAGLAPDSV